MKKTVIALSLVAASSWLAAGTGTLAEGRNTVSGGTSNCGVIPSANTATVQLSTGVSGAWDCSDTAAGVAARHAQGAGKIFSASSNGGRLSETAGEASGLATAAQTARDAS